MEENGTFISSITKVTVTCCNCYYSKTIDVYHDDMYSHDPKTWILDLSDNARESLEERGWVYTLNGWTCPDCNY